MAIEWYIRQGDKQHGPVSSSQLKQFAQQQKITPDVMVRAGTQGQWMPAGRVQGLFTETTAPAPPSPSPPRQAAAPPVAQAVPPPPPPPTGAAPPRVAPSVAIPRAVEVSAPRFVTAAPVAPPNTKRMWSPAHGLGVGALVAGLLALMTFWLPWVTLWLAAVGLTLGGIGLLIGLAAISLASVRQGAGIGFAIAGTVISALGLLLTLGFSFFAAQGGSSTREPAHVAAAAPGPAPVSPPPVQTEPPAEPEPQWIDAGQAAQLGDVRVQVLSASVGRVMMQDFLGGKQRSGEPMLQIKLQIANTSQTRKIDYAGWKALPSNSDEFGGLLGAEAKKLLNTEANKRIGNFSASLTDNFGNRYQQQVVGGLDALAGAGQSTSIYPDKPTEDVLTFQVPIRAFEYLRLELPAEAFGEEGAVRFQIPKKMVTGAP